MSTDNTTLEKRIRRLEQQNAWLGILAIICCSVVLVAAAMPPGESRASAFVLNDPDGMTRAELTIRDGTVGLFIKDESGRDRLSAIHAAEETGLFIRDEAGTSRIGVAQFAHGGGGVALHGEESKGAAVLYFKQTGSLRFFDTDGQVTNQVDAKPAD